MIKYKTYGSNNEYNFLNQPQYCEKCKKISEKPIIKEIDHVERITCEAKLYCRYCNELVNFWMYGHFQKEENGYWR